MELSGLRLAPPFHVTFWAARSIHCSWGDFMNDIRFALRVLRKNPGFAAAAVLTLALGIGSTTTIFSVFRGVLLRPLPFGDPGRIVRLEEKWLPRFTRF